MARYKCPSCGASYNGKRCRSCSYENFSDETSCSVHHKEIVFDDGNTVGTAPGTQPRQAAPQKTAPQPAFRKKAKGKNAKAAKPLRTLLIVYVIFLVLNMAYGAFSSVREITSHALPEPEPETISLPAEGIVLYDTDGLVIKADWQDGQEYIGDIAIIAENSTDRNLGISVRDLVVNGYMMDLSYLYCQPQAGATYAGALRLDEEDLKNAGIETIAEISFCLEIYDSDTYEAMAQSDTVTLRAAAPQGFTQPAIEGGTLFWEGEGVSIYFLGYHPDAYHTENFLEGDFQFYIENNSSRTLDVYSIKTRVNAEEADLALWHQLLPGTRAVSRMYLYYLDNLGIDSLNDVQTLELQLEIGDANDWGYAVQTELISVDPSK